MTKSEFGRVILVIRGAYQKDDFLNDDEAVEIWYQMLKDLTYEQVKMAVQKHAMTNKWTPSIAEIRESIVEIQADKTDWSDGWEEVLRAIRRFGYCDESGAMKSISPMTAEVVKRLGWQQICQSEQSELMAIRANFRMIYEEKHKSFKEDAQLPIGLKKEIYRITGNGLLLND